MTSIFLFLSAFIPMYALLVLQIFIQIINGNATFNILNTISLSLFSLFIIAGAIGLFLTIKKSKQKIEEIKVLSSTNITDQHFFGYISIFILFTLSFDITNMSMFITTIAILIIIGIVYIHNKIYYINPLLNILGFSFYEITYISKTSDTKKTAKMFYYGHKDLVGKWVKVKICLTNFSFILNEKK